MLRAKLQAELGAAFPSRPSHPTRETGTAPRHPQPVYLGGRGVEGGGGGKLSLTKRWRYTDKKEIKFSSYIRKGAVSKL